MSTTQQPEALRLAEQYDYGDPIAYSNMWRVAVCNELRRQHTRIAELEAQLESIGAGGVSGPLMGCASIAANAGSEPVAEIGSAAGDDAEFGQRAVYPLMDIDHFEYGTKLYTHPSPPEGMEGEWMPIETAPVAGLILLVVEDSAGERRVFPAEASHENGVWVWQATAAQQGDALDAEQHEMDARHAAIYRWMLSHVADVLSIFDNWFADEEADTDELHDALAARAAQEGKSHDN